MKKIFLKIVFFCLIATLMPIFSYADIDTKEPTINARHAVVLDRNSKQAIYEKKINEKCKMASTTKIMTAIVVIENSNLDDIVEISSNSSRTGGSRLGLSKNDKVSIKDLLYGLMLRSGNDAAVALAESTGGSTENFALMMNKKAKELNLSNTNFVTPHGLDSENHYTTALDLAILTDYALRNEILSKIVNTRSYVIYINRKPRTITNTNELLGNFEGIYGVKTGFTNGANRCLVTSCRRGDLDFICVVLGCDTKKDRTKDTIKLLNYSFDNYSLLNAKEFVFNKFNDWKSSHENSFSITKGKSQTLNLYLDENDLPFSNIAVKESEKNNIYVEISFNSYFDAPLVKETKIGTLIFSINNNKYYHIDILNNNEIIKKNIFDYMSFIFENYVILLAPTN